MWYAHRTVRAAEIRIVVSFPRIVMVTRFSAVVDADGFRVSMRHIGAVFGPAPMTVSQIFCRAQAFISGQPERLVLLKLTIPKLEHVCSYSSVH
jgi:hypothetical protein